MNWFEICEACDGLHKTPSSPLDKLWINDFVFLILKAEFRIASLLSQYKRDLFYFIFFVFLFLINKKSRRAHD